MTIHQALDHPWLARGAKAPARDEQIPSSRYTRARDSVRARYVSSHLVDVNNVLFIGCLARTTPCPRKDSQLFLPAQAQATGVQDPGCLLRAKRGPAPIHHPAIQHHRGRGTECQLLLPGTGCFGANCHLASRFQGTQTEREVHEEVRRKRLRTDYQ